LWLLSPHDNEAIDLLNGGLAFLDYAGKRRGIPDLRANFLCPCEHCMFFRSDFFCRLRTDDGQTGNYPPSMSAREFRVEQIVGSQAGQEFSALTRRYSRKVVAVAQNEIREIDLAPIESNFDHICRKMMLAASPDIMKIANRAAWVGDVGDAGSMVGKSYHAKIVSPSSTTPIRECRNVQPNRVP
jgi:hypothetical protein